MAKESKVYYVGRREMMKCGQYAEIIEYIDGNTIRVRFDNGYECIAWPEQFRRGQIKNKAIKFKCDVGDTNTATNGHIMTVIERKDKNHILIRFDDGFEKWVTTQTFLSGHVSHPKYPTQKGQSKYIGQKIEKDGHTAECIAIEDGKLVIQFDTGEKRSMMISQFSKGFLFPHENRGENISKLRKKSNFEKFIGEKSKNNIGLEMETIDYKDANHILVRFTETGYETWTRRQAFLDGKVEDKINTANQYLSIRIMQRCGLYAQITSYTPEDKNPKCKTAAKYVISFDDGVSFENKGMHSFLHGNLQHPKRPMASGSIINNVKLIKKRFNIGTEPQILCECQNCGWKDIASFDEIYAHVCNMEEPIYEI